MINRVGGLVSGMDIDALVEKIMNAERAPLYKLQQQKTKYEWQRDAYRSINTKLNTFSNYTFDNLIMSNKFVTKTPSISGTNSSKVSAKAGSGAAGSLDIQAVKQLATNASTGVKNVQNTTHRYVNGGDTLNDLGVTGGEIKLNVTTTDTNGVSTTSEKTITFSQNETIDSFVAKLQSDEVGLKDSKFDASTGRLTIGGKDVSYSFADSASEEKLKEFGFATTNQSTAIKLADGKTNAPKESKLTDLGFTTGTLALKVGDDVKSFTIEADDTIDSLLGKLNAIDSGVKASYNESTGKFSIAATDTKKSVTAADDSSYKILTQLGIKKTATTSDSHFIQDTSPGQQTTGSSKLGHLGLGLDGGEDKLTLNVIQANGEMKEMSISFTKDDTIDSFIKRLNSSGAGVTAIFSNGQITMSANNTGKAKDSNVTSEIQVVGAADSSGKQLLGQLGFLTQGQVTSDGNIDLAANRSQNAVYAVNGLVMESRSNSVNISGYEINLIGTFNEGNINDANNSIIGTPTDGVSVTSTNDIDTMVDKIKEFVNKYNELIAGINDQLTESKYRAYAPLTAEQRKDMSESEQKLWDEKAKSGLLRSDAILRSGLSDMRSALGGRVNGLGDNVIDTLADMGITTSSSYKDGGKLIIDDTKLRKALTDDPDRVVNTLTQSGTKNVTTGEDTRGLLVRMRKSVTDFMQKIESKAGRATMTDNQFALGKSLISTDERITKLQERLKNVETRYWKQFTAMEQAINKANSQSGVLAQFGGQ